MEHVIDCLEACNTNNEICWLKIVEVIRYENKDIKSIEKSIIELRDENKLSPTIHVILKEHRLHSTEYYTAVKRRTFIFMKSLRNYYLSRTNAIIDAKITQLTAEIDDLNSQKI